MKIIKFTKFLENSTQKVLNYFLFDWDDNILHMSTKIHMDKLVDGNWVPTDVSTEEFARVRNDKDNWRLLDDNGDKAFSDFRDFGPRGDDAFIQDVQESIKRGNFGPSWGKFIECLESGSLFAIITARGHEPDSMRKAVEWIIHTQMKSDQVDNMINNLMYWNNEFKSNPESVIEHYLDTCDFIGVSSEFFLKKNNLSGTAANPEEGKKLAIRQFTQKAHEWGQEIGALVKVGFSDDDKRNVEHVLKLFKDELSLTYAIKFFLYDTSDRTKKGGEKRVIHRFSEKYEIGDEFTVNDDTDLPKGHEDIKKGDKLKITKKWKNASGDVYGTDKSKDDKGLYSTDIDNIKKIKESFEEEEEISNDKSDIDSEVEILDSIIELIKADSLVSEFLKDCIGNDRITATDKLKKNVFTKEQKRIAENGIRQMNKKGLLNKYE
jgi:hypothetical protein